jgi:hypothetical protein
MMKRRPSSMTEKAHSSIAPKAIGVKSMRKMRRNVIRLLIIAQSSKLKAQSNKIVQS